MRGDPPQLVLTETSVLSRYMLGGLGELEQLPEEGLILDVRGNGGGLLALLAAAGAWLRRLRREL